MANPPHIRFRLKVGASAFQNVTPIWGGELKHSTKIEPGQQFYRTEQGGEISFYRSDYDLINDAPFDTKFFLRVERMEAGAWQLVRPLVEFYKTDCTFNPDEKKCTLSGGDSFDSYLGFMAAMGKEINLIDTEPPTTPVDITKRAIFQIYLPGSKFIANFNAFDYWETPVAPFFITPSGDVPFGNANHNKMLDDYGFGVTKDGAGNFDFGFSVIPGDGLTIDVSGRYRHDFVNDRPNFPAFHIGNDFSIDGFLPPGGGLKIQISSSALGSVVYETPILSNPFFPYGQPPHAVPLVTYTSLTNPTDQVQAFLFAPYVRMLTDETTVNGTPTLELSENDPFKPGSYSRALPIETRNFIYSDGHSTTPTRWGRFADDVLHYAGEYFTQPAAPTGATIYPIAPNTWTGASAWFYIDDALRQVQEAGSTVRTVRDCYKLSDSLQAILTETETGIIHDDDPAYSDFFYSLGTNTIRGDRKVPVIVPISNVIRDYDQPAKKALIRLSEVLELLKRFHNAYPYVSSENRLILEHYDFYDKGHSYTTDQIGVELTGRFDPRTKKPISHGQNGFKYSKLELPERIEPGWMIEVSDPFKGFPIVVNSGYVKKGNVDSTKIQRFISDIDFMFITGDSLPTQGFVFLECVEDVNGKLSVPFVDFQISPDEIYRLNNGYAAFIHAHEKYHRHGLPATDVKLNKTAIEATSTIRAKEQVVRIPDVGDIDPTKLVKTGLGNGRIESMERNLTGTGYELILKHH